MTNIRSVINGALRLCENDIRSRSVHIDIACAERLYVVINPKHSMEVLAHLIRNAIMYAYPPGYGGKLRILAKRHLKAEFVLRIEDDGQGIDAKFLAKVFDPIVATAWLNGVHGIGLAVVRNLVENHLRGRILIDSNPSYGTAITLVFPMKPPPLASSAAIDRHIAA